MERPTFEWVHKTCIPKFAELGRIAFPMLEWDIDAAIFLCRLRYRIVPAPLPEESDILGLATYYKLHWNSTSGAATIEQAIDKYNKYAR